MKRKRQLAVMLLVMAICYSISYFYLIRPNSTYKYKQFFEEKADFDVLFFGSSHVMNGLSPMDLWDEYGITSYNFGNSNSLLPQTYWTIVEATKYHKPKVIVLDTYFVHWDDKTQGVNWTHDSFDCFPLDMTKYKLAKDLFDDRNSITELLFPYTVFHNRWEEVNYTELRQKITGESNWNKGCEFLLGQCKLENYSLIPESDYLEYDSVGLEYLRKIAEFCNDNEIKLVLMCIPCTTEEEVQMKLNYVSVLAKEMDLPFINYSYSDVVDIETDFGDESHLNATGARKLTLALGEYLSQHYNLTDKHNDPEYAGWNENYESFLDHIK